MSEARELAEFIDYRLSWIDFPWVDVEMDGTTGLFNFLKCPACKPPWEDSKISAASYR